jgi:hypothetical protein
MPVSSACFQRPDPQPPSRSASPPHHHHQRVPLRLPSQRVREVMHDPPNRPMASVAVHAHRSMDPHGGGSGSTVGGSAAAGSCRISPTPSLTTRCGPAGYAATTGPLPDHAAPSPPAQQWPSGPRRTRPEVITDQRRGIGPEPTGAQRLGDHRWLVGAGGVGRRLRPNRRHPPVTPPLARLSRLPRPSSCWMPARSTRPSSTA